MVAEGESDQDLVRLLIDYEQQKISKSFVFMDTAMEDSDCSEDYDSDPFFQQSGLSYRM